MYCSKLLLFSSKKRRCICHSSFLLLSSCYCFHGFYFHKKGSAYVISHIYIIHITGSAYVISHFYFSQVVIVFMAFVSTKKEVLKSYVIYISYIIHITGSAYVIGHFYCSQIYIHVMQAYIKYIKVYISSIYTCYAMRKDTSKKGSAYVISHFYCSQVIIVFMAFVSTLFEGWAFSEAEGFSGNDWYASCFYNNNILINVIKTKFGSRVFGWSILWDSNHEVMDSWFPFLPKWKAHIM